MFEFLEKLPGVLKEDPRLALQMLMGVANFPIFLAGIVAMLLDQFWLCVGLVIIAFALAALCLGFDFKELWRLYCIVLASISSGLVTTWFTGGRSRLTRRLLKALGVLLFAPALFLSLVLAQCSVEGIT